jgi:hypothetical protein
VKIAKNLNLVVPIGDDGNRMFVHSSPISRLVFEEYFLVISKTFTAIFSEGLGAITGSRIANLMLRQVAQEMGVWDKVQKGLLNEINRLTNVVMLGDTGWTSLPLQHLLDNKMLSEDDIFDIQGELIFFTCVHSVNKKNQIEEMMNAANGLWGSSVTSLTCTEYLTSLPTLTEAENTGETATTSSVLS